MKILVTGVKGFIGTYIAEKLKKDGHIVAGADISAAPTESEAEYYQLDILKNDPTSILVKIHPDVIIHCAGLANVPYSLEHPLDDYQANTGMVYRLLESMRQCGLHQSRFILLSSAAVYGQPRVLPIKETDKSHPMSPYALHKKMAEDICLYYANHCNFNIRILRVFSAYGPGLRKQIFWDMYQKIKKNGCLELFGTGEESRDYIYIDDLVEAISLIAFDEKNNHVIWNVANGQEVFIKDIAAVFAETMHIGMDKIHFSGTVREGDPANWCADVSRIKKLGYNSKINIENGINHYIRWLRDNTI
jgi:nucleoside-diphosphate-sugar epimerase